MSDPDVTRQSLATGIVAELEAEGYHDAEPVGRGGFGVVYRCREPALDRIVAIKVLNADQDDVDLEHFASEQRAMGRVSGHPNIVPVLHSGLTYSGRPYIVMPYLSRNTLAAWVKSHGPLPAHEALTAGVRLAGALDPGTDARAVLAALRDAGARPSVYVYGPAGAEDVEIAKAIGKSPNELYRMLDRLVRRGYVQRLEGDRFSLTLKMFGLAHFHAPIRRLVSFAAPVMRDFSASAAQACHLAVYDRGSVVVIAQQESSTYWAMSLRVGAQMSLFHTGLPRTVVTVVANAVTTLSA